MHLLNEMLLYGMGRDGEGWFILFLFAFLVVYRYNGGDWPGAWPRTTSNGGFHVKNVVLFFLCLCGFFGYFVAIFSLNSYFVRLFRVLGGSLRGKL